MRLPRDFAELLAAFDAEEVRYVLVGGYAVSLHSRPRSTKDVDFWIDGGDNLERVARALTTFGAPVGVTDAVRNLGPDEFVFMGRSPLRVDLIRRIKGLPRFDQAFARSLQLRWGTRLVRVLSLDDLLAAKRAVGRPVDRRDVKALERARGKAHRPKPRAVAPTKRSRARAAHGKTTARDRRRT